jgi:hypothetical protein
MAEQNLYDQMGASQGRLEDTYGGSRGIWGYQGMGGPMNVPYQGGMDPMMSAQERDMMNQQGQGAYESLMQQQGGPSNMGRIYEDIIGGPGNTFMDPMIDALGEDYQTQLNRQIPGMRADAAGAGALGGSRDKLMQGLRASESDRNFARDASMMRGQGYETDMDWKMQIARQADQGIQADRDRLFNIWDQSGMRSGQAVDRQSGYGQDVSGSQQWAGAYSPNLMDQGLAPAQMWNNYSGRPWDALNNMSSVNANYDPTVLDSETGYGWGAGGSNSGSFGFGFG